MRVAAPAGGHGRRPGSSAARLSIIVPVEDMTGPPARSRPARPRAPNEPRSGRPSTRASRADPDPSLHHRVRQLPAAGRADLCRDQHPGRGGDQPGPPRLGVPRATGARSRRPSSEETSRRSSPPRRSNSASTWVRSIWSSRSRPRSRSLPVCNESAGPGIRSGARAGPGSSPSFGATSWPRPSIGQQMIEGDIETTAIPRNPLDVLCQQIVAAVAMGPRQPMISSTWSAGPVPIPSLPDRVFDATLDMLGGPLPLRPLRRAAAPGQLGPRRGHR